MGQIQLSTSAHAIVFAIDRLANPQLNQRDHEQVAHLVGFDRAAIPRGCAGFSLSERGFWDNV
jgi:hypothetical protein